MYNESHLKVSLSYIKCVAVVLEGQGSHEAYRRQSVISLQSFPVIHYFFNNIRGAIQHHLGLKHCTGDQEHAMLSLWYPNISFDSCNVTHTFKWKTVNYIGYCICWIIFVTKEEMEKKSSFLWHTNGFLVYQTLYSAISLLKQKCITK